MAAVTSTSWNRLDIVSEPAMSLPGINYGETLDKFHDRCLYLGESELKSKNDAINKFVRFLHQQQFLGSHSVAEVVKGGSLGKGTAVRGQSDVDLVVYLNGFTEMEVFKRKRTGILFELERKARKYHGDGFQILQLTPYSLWCKFQDEDMDVLPAVKLTKIFGNLSAVYDAIARSDKIQEEAQNFSASLTTYQISFVSDQPDTVKRVIRLVKYWKKAKNVPILSYTVELVTIYAFEQGFQKSTRELFNKVMDLLAHVEARVETLKIAFTEYYSEQYISLQAPYVLDPANPFKNTLGGVDPCEIRRAAQEALEESLRLPEMLDKESLDKFHDRFINLTKLEKDLKHTMIDQFVKFLHQQQFLDSHSVAEVIKGGSLGKGTAVRGQSDVDLVVYLNGFSTMQDFKSKRTKILLDLADKASNYLGEGLQVMHLTPYSVCCKFQGEDMDILPAIGIIKTYKQLSTAYDVIARSDNITEEAQNFSAPLSTYQVSFVSSESEIVKRVIRLVKFWKKAKAVPILSYTVELVTIYVNRQNSAMSTKQLFEAVMTYLRDSADLLEIAFDDNYESLQYTRRFVPPYVLDPANPFKDTFGASDIRAISRSAQESLNTCNSLPGMSPEESLDKFHDRCVQPFSAEQHAKRAAVDCLARFLHQQKFIGKHSVAEVITGGSLRKGTSVRGQSDVDLLVYLNGLSGMEDLKSKCVQIICELERNVKSYGNGEVQGVCSTDDFVQLTFNGEKLRILPALKITGDGLTAAYQAIARANRVEEEALAYSASLIPTQIKFVLPQPETVKRVIRLIKFWKKENGVPILSYTVELVTIHAWLTKGSKYGYDTLELFKAVMDLLKDAGSLKVAFDDNYSSDDYTRYLQDPYVLDPANPFKNTLRVEDTSDISRAAMKALGGQNDTDNNSLISKNTCNGIKATCDVFKAVADILHNGNETGDRNLEGPVVYDPANPVNDSLISKNTYDMITGTCDKIKEAADLLHNVTIEDSDNSSQSGRCVLM